MINELKIIENIDILFNRKIVIYGIGDRGKETLKMLKKAGISVEYLCDSNCSFWGKYIDGIEVLSIPKLKLIDLNENLLIVIAIEKIQHIDQVIDTIIRIGLKTEYIATYMGVKASLYKNMYDLRINNNYRIIETQKQKLIDARYVARGIELVEIILKALDKIGELLVYQPGKVGSSTIIYSLGLIGIPAVHIHYLYAKNYNLTYDIRSIMKSYRNMLKKTNAKIITLVREPLSRDISAIFEKFSGHDLYTYYQSSTHSFTEHCIELIRKYYIGGECEMCNQYDWFDKELKSVFDIDIFTYPFDREKGYTIIKQNNIEVLVMKLEKLNTLESVIAEFVEAPHFKLVNFNEQDSKPYKYLYKNVKNTIKIPKDIVNFYYKNNARMDHFYSEEEKMSFLKKLEKNIN